MNDRTAGAALLVIGVVAMFAAIVGGGIKIQQIEVGSVQSKWRQWLLGAFGLAIGVVGLIMVLPDDQPTAAVGSADNLATVDDNAVADEPVADDTNAGDNVADANANDAAIDQNVDGNGEEVPQ